MAFSNRSLQLSSLSRRLIVLKISENDMAVPAGGIKRNMTSFAPVIRLPIFLLK